MARPIVWAGFFYYSIIRKKQFTRGKVDALQNNLKTYVEVEFDGQQKLMKFDYNSQCDLEERFGKGINRILSEEQIGFNVIRLFYWAGLKWKNKGLTVEAVGNMLGKKIQEEGSDLGALMEPVMKALKLSRLLGDMEEGSEQPELTEEEYEKN